MKIKYLVAVVNAACLFLIVCCLSVQIPTFNLNFYKKEFTELDTARNMSMAEDEVLRVTRELLNYMKGARRDLSVQAVVDGQEREFFNQREIDHMVDVKNLYTAGFLVRNISAIVFALTIVFFALRNQENITAFARSYILVFLSLIAVFVVVGFIVSTDFDRYFTVFHEIFFTNDLWVLDPSTDLLINLVPLQFFMDIAEYIALTFVQLAAAVLGLSYIYLKFFKDRAF